MEPFERLEARALPMRGANIDTDRILPSRFMQKPRADGFGRYFFHDLRFDAVGAERPDYIVNNPAHRDARILIAGENFGCGSSREQAVYAVFDYGFRAVVAPSFGDIFYANALKNGLLPVVLPGMEIEALFAACEADPSTRLAIDLQNLRVSRSGQPDLPFAIDDFNRQLLLTGQDEIAFTLGLADEISTFEELRRAHSAWL
ncbi:3-isopropylmalate/(R)-2-methylmalate dehydratase small subunit [Bosea sp. OK403]|uniref:3-isopropylmalate dehydratase small subunit n=1 Tax=Bosea sp. OK403 TaxID=1855286 RepID=UPI0008E9C061|nr:3-isopropylmalate dehydratase small subunit [Bosea sp. OK403]SFI04457.1 3-isopropylmalate/(R)-2-methylmalate dehydratase small subunit [Bosea sp. OK403]